MAGNNQGPWGGGGRGGGGDDRDRNNGGGGGRRPGQEPQMPEFDEIVTKTRDQLRVLMGGGGGKGGKPSGGGGGDGPQISRGMIGLGVALALVAWLTASFYTVRPEERSVELFLGECIEPCVGQPGLNFAPWPVVTAEVIEIGEENVPGNLRSSRNTNQSVGADTGLMLTGDENIVEIGFQVVWNITSPHRYLFNLQNPPETIEAVAESSMREIIAQSQLANLNRERAVLRDRLQESVQSTLDEYDSGVNIIRINLDCPPTATCRTPSRSASSCRTAPMPMPTVSRPRRVVARLKSLKAPKAIAPGSSTRPAVKPRVSSACWKNSSRRPT
jgi:membrane protease subunit HflK